MLIYQINTMVFTFGLCIGSFLNVCIYRLPISKSIIYPRSSCTGCGNIIRFYDNFPVISYLWLKGRCRYCGMNISLRYPMVEIMSGLFALCVYLKFSLSLEGLVYYVFISTLLVITYIDIDHQIIPDIISLPGIPIFFIASFALPAMTYKDALLGILIGGGSLYTVAELYYLITKKEGMGGGDIKLMAMIGALLGWKGVLFTIFVASAVGTVVGVIIMFYTRKTLKLAVPFGPFLAIGAMAYCFFGDEIIRWYLKF